MWDFRWVGFNSAAKKMMNAVRWMYSQPKN